MDHRERIERAIHREKVDRIPVSFWRHFPVDDQNPESLAKSTIAFQDLYDLDLVKVSPSSSFCLQDWGAQDIWNGHPEGTRDYLEPVIKTPEDWSRLKVLDPKRGHLGGQIECLKLIKSKLDPGTPIIQSIFNPLAQAKNLAGKAELQFHLRKYPDQLKAGLKIITQSTANFIEECLKLGIDGIFLAVQHASFDLLSIEEFLSFGKHFDSKLFALMDAFKINMLHVHGSNIMFEKVADYPAQIINWHDRETAPDLRTGQQMTKVAVCGGLGRIETMVLGTNQMIRQEIDDAMGQTGGNGLIIGTGCVLPQTAPMGNIFAAVEYAHSLKANHV